MTHDDDARVADLWARLQDPRWGSVRVVLSTGMSEPMPLRQVINRLLDGTIRIPGFQRHFVWEPDRAALLMDSIWKGYPIGSVLLWRTRSRLKTEKRLGVFELPRPDKDYPVDYVLDGQQRLTSIFTTFQTTLTPSLDDPDLWLPIYYDFDSEADAQDSRFVALKEADVMPERHFPLLTFFSPVEFQQQTRELGDEQTTEIVNVQQRFLEALVPVETFESEDRTSVAIVFERVNRMGVELDVFQLLTAWTWSDEFDLQEQFKDLAEEFASFGFGPMGENSDLMLRCCAAVLQQDPSPSSLVNLNGSVVRDSFGVIETAMKRAIDYLRRNFEVHHIKLLPYESMLIPLTAFFSIDQSGSVTAAQPEDLRRWFWRSAFSHRYSGNPQRTIRRDIEEAVKLRRGETSLLGDVTCSIDAGFFTTHKFNLRTVATKAFVLMLADRKPLTFLSGQKVRLGDVLSEPNRSEYHHCYPKAMLTAAGESDEIVGCLANFAIISRDENREISDSKPSQYRNLMPQDVAEVLDSALLPSSLFGDDYDQFLDERAEMLADHVGSLIA